MNEAFEKLPSFDKKCKVMDIALLKSLRPRMTIVDTDDADEWARLDALYAKTLAKLGVMRSVCERASSISMSAAERARCQGDLDRLIADIDALSLEINGGVANNEKKTDCKKLALSLANRMNAIESDGVDDVLRSHFHRKLKKKKATEDKLKSWMDSLYDS